MIEPIDQPDDVESRAPANVDEAIDAELSFHLDSLQADLELDGVPPGKSAAAVRRRFGDVEQYRNACRRIAMKEEIMKQRMQYAAMGIMLFIIAGLAVYALVARQRTVEMMRAMDHERARAEAAADYLTQLLSAQDALGDAREVSVREVLDEASSRVAEWNLDGHPDIETKLREAIEAAKQAIEGPATSNENGDRSSDGGAARSQPDDSASVLRSR